MTKEKNKMTMQTQMLEGKNPARLIREWVAENVADIKKRHGWSPGLVTVQVGCDAASERYIRNQIKACNSIGIFARHESFPEGINREDFTKSFTKIAEDPEVDGIILQTPLPKGWNRNEIMDYMPPAKDVEGVHPENLGRLYLGENDIPLPCTAHAAISLLECYGRSTFEGKKCTVLGRSPNVGRAAALMMLHRQATVTICHTRTKPEDIAASLAGADIVIAAAGVAGIVKPQELSAKAWVIDVGTNVTEDGRLVGDVAPFEPGMVAAISPVPGGVGPLTVAMLLSNLLLCASRRRLNKSITLPALSELRGS